MTKYKPLSNFIIIAPEIAPETTESGIIIPEQARKNANEGRVFDIGPDVTSVKPGDIVVFTEYSPYRMEDSGVEICLVAETNLLMVKPLDEAKYPPMQESVERIPSLKQAREALRNSNLAAVAQENLR